MPVAVSFFYNFEAVSLNVPIEYLIYNELCFLQPYIKFTAFNVNDCLTTVLNLLTHSICLVICFAEKFAFPCCFMWGKSNFF